MLIVTEPRKDTEFQPNELMNNVFETLDCLVSLILQGCKSTYELAQDAL